MIKDQNLEFYMKTDQELTDLQHRVKYKIVKKYELYGYDKLKKIEYSYLKEVAGMILVPFVTVVYSVIGGVKNY